MDGFASSNGPAVARALHSSFADLPAALGVSAHRPVLGSRLSLIKSEVLGPKQSALSLPSMGQASPTLPLNG
jgi:hypothetical protein